VIQYLVIPFVALGAGLWLGTAAAWFAADAADVGLPTRLWRAFAWLPAYLRGRLS